LLFVDPGIEGMKKCYGLMYVSWASHHIRYWNKAKIDLVVNVLEKCAGEDGCNTCECLDECRSRYDELCDSIGGFLPGEEQKLGIRRKKREAVMYTDLGGHAQVQECKEGYVIVTAESSVFLDKEQFFRLIATYAGTLMKMSSKD
jgi:hypothetical protein